jgi:AcrR family transcriptional regulator
VVKQVKALETRKRIVDAAANLFAENGYLETDLRAICQAAHVTSGAFYYHFTSKEDLQSAIIEQAWPQTLALYKAFRGIPRPTLENVITMTFAATAIYRQRPDWWCALQFVHAMASLGPQARREVGERSETFAELMTAVISADEISNDFTPEQVGDLLFLGMTGSTMTSDSHGADHTTALNRQTLLWRALLAAILPADSVPRFQQFLTETAARYTSAVTDVEMLHKEVRADIERVRHKEGIDLQRFYVEIGLETD